MAGFLVMVAAPPARADVILYGRVTDLLGKPVPNARVHVLSGSEHQTVDTDGNGNYRVQVGGTGDVTVVIGAGKEHTFRRGKLKEGSVQQFDVEVEIADGEVVRIMDSKPPAVPPKPATDVRVAPPYSEEAIVRDAWAKAWFLLDIDERGKVVRLKLLRRPGFDLDKIAVEHAFKQTFTPALDEYGKPMRTQILWSIEWPAHGWLTEYAGVATRLPVDAYAVDPLKLGFGGMTEGDLRMSDANELYQKQQVGVFQPLVPTPGPNTLAHVPCLGSGPLNLDSRYPVYRDCSRPNMSRAAKLAWYDGTGPLPEDPPELRPLPEPPVVIPKTDWIPRIVSASAAVTLAGATIYSFTRARYWGDLATGERNSYTNIDYELYNDAVRRQSRWNRLTLLTGFATAGAIAITAFTWLRHQPKSSFSVQPDGNGGGSASYTRTF